MDGIRETGLGIRKAVSRTPAAHPLFRIPNPKSRIPAKPMSELTPREIVNELDRYIIGQQDAKRAVAIALRSR